MVNKVLRFYILYLSNSRINIVLLCLALFLLGLNITGIFINLRNDQIYKANLQYKFNVSLTEKETYESLDQVFRMDISDSVKAVEACDIISRGMAHMWENADSSDLVRYNLQIPPYENYILYLFSYLNFRFEKYEFLNWRKALERGVGACSQHAIVLAEVLIENDIVANIVLLEGHVVVTAQVEGGKWITLDPDFGVVIPYSISEIEKRSDIITEFYAKEGYTPEIIDNLKRIYGKEGNVIYKSVFAYKGALGVFEYMAYGAIWIIPILLGIPFLLDKFWKTASKVALYTASKPHDNVKRFFSSRID
jgi:hypothetical protein